MSGESKFVSFYFMLEYRILNNKIDMSVWKNM